VDKFTKFFLLQMGINIVVLFFISTFFDWFLKFTGTDIILLSMFSIGLPTTIFTYILGIAVILIFAELLGDIEDFVFKKSYNFFKKILKILFLYVFYLLVTKSKTNEFFGFIYSGLIIPLFTLTASFAFASFMSQRLKKTLMLKSGLSLMLIVFIPGFYVLGEYAFYNYVKDYINLF
jgi:hypothetical protein